MKIRSYPASVRVRLTLWYVGVMVVVLAVYAAGVFVFVSRAESAGLDEQLRADFLWPAEMLDRLPDGTIDTYDASGDSDSSPWLQVWSPSGELLYSTWNARRNPVPDAARLALESTGRIVTVLQVTPSMRVLSGESMIGGQPVIIQVARSEYPLHRSQSQLLFLLFLGFPLGIATAGLGGYTLARRALAPVDRMAERARSITAERLEDRLPVDNPNDELGRLASVFNEMLTRLESSFRQMRRFTSDVSHELRTPLTAIRSVGEVGLLARKNEASYRDIVASMLEEVDRLANLVDRLLMLSRAETGESRLSVEVFNLGELAEEVRDQLEVLAEEKQQTITLDRTAAPLWSGDRVVLRQALLNLVDNAIKYTPQGGRVSIRVCKTGDQAILEVSDTGAGIPEALQARVFERFYRVDESRSRENGGMGLGLSIAQWGVEANGGKLTLESRGPGSTFRIVLPLNTASEPTVWPQAV